jgi:radical SAM protein with 4Fe4S-binding SPASM domain
VACSPFPPKKRWYLAERSLGTSRYLVNPHDLRIHALDGAGRTLWETIDGRTTVPELTRRFCHDSGIPRSPAISRAVQSFVDQLRDNDLIYDDGDTGFRQPKACREFERTLDVASCEDHAQGEQADLINQMWRSAARDRVILKADLELTFSCNHACLHCYNTSERRKGLTTEDYRQLLDDLALNGCLFVGLTGGEVFTRRDAIDIARHAKDRKFSLRILTNGSLIGEKLADEIAALHPETVEISLCGTHEATHDYFSQAPGSYQKVIRALRLLAAREVNTVIRYVFSRYSVAEAPELPELARSIGVKYMYPKPHLFPTVDGNCGPTGHRVTDDQIRFLASRGMITPTRHPRCYAGVSRCRISPWGDVHACEFLPHNFGSLKTRPLRELWETSPQKDVWEDDRIHDPPSCAGCSNRDICGRCPAMSYLDDGSLLTSSSQACRLSRLTREGLTARDAPASPGSRRTLMTLPVISQPSSLR